MSSQRQANDFVGLMQGVAWRVAALAFVLALAYIAGDLAPERADREFYSAAAQVVPVVLLVLVVEARWFSLGTSSTPKDPEGVARFILGLVGGLIIFGMFVAAEFSSLTAIADDDPSSRDPAIVYQCLGVGFAAIAGYALFGEARRDNALEPSADHRPSRHDEDPNAL